MKYSLRSLMVVVTLVCVVLGLLGARIEWLRRRAAYHDGEAIRFREESALAMVVTPSHPELPDQKGAEDEYRQIEKAIESGFLLAHKGDSAGTIEFTNEDIVALLKSDELQKQSVHHSQLSVLYKRAVYRPWTVVDETPPKK
jgi:hypothetical protein